MMLDVGCGALRTGQMLIPFLARGHYHCVDPARGLVQDAIKLQLGYDLLQRKLPVFNFNYDFIAPAGAPSSLLGDDANATASAPKYDIMMAQSIFTHTADDLFTTAMTNLAPRFHAGSKLIASVFFAQDHPEPETPLTNNPNYTGWIYPGEPGVPAFVKFEEEHLSELLAPHGLTWELADWPLTPEGMQKWIVIRKA